MVSGHVEDCETVVGRLERSIRQHGVLVRQYAHQVSQEAAVGYQHHCFFWILSVEVFEVSHDFFDSLDHLLVCFKCISVIPALIVLDWLLVIHYDVWHNLFDFILGKTRENNITLVNSLEFMSFNH